LAGRGDKIVTAWRLTPLAAGAYRYFDMKGDGGQRAAPDALLVPVTNRFCAGKHYVLYSSAGFIPAKSKIRHFDGDFPEPFRPSPALA